MPINLSAYTNTFKEEQRKKIASTSGINMDAYIEPIRPNRLKIEAETAQYKKEAEEASGSILKNTVAGIAPTWAKAHVATAKFLNPLRKVEVRPVFGTETETIRGGGGVQIAHDLAARTLEMIPKASVQAGINIFGRTPSEEAKQRLGIEGGTTGERYSKELDKIGWTDDPSLKNLPKAMLGVIKTVGFDVLDLIGTGQILSGVSKSFLKSVFSSPTLGIKSSAIEGMTAQEAAETFATRFQQEMARNSSEVLAGRMTPVQFNQKSAQMIAEARRVGKAFQDGGLPQLNPIAKKLEDLALTLNEDITRIGKRNYKPGITKEIPAEQTLPGYRPVGGTAQPQFGLSVQPVEPVGFGKSGAEGINLSAYGVKSVANTQPIVSKELESLVSEISKAKSVEEFVSNNIFNKSLSGEQTKALSSFKGESVADQLTDFYNQYNQVTIKPRPQTESIRKTYSKISNPVVQGLSSAGKTPRLDKLYRNESGILNGKYYKHANLDQQPQLVVKIGGLKELNKQGHALGHTAIRETEDLIQQSFPDAVVSHLGGKNFAVITEGMDEKSVLENANKLLALNEKGYGITARWGKDFKTADSLFARDDAGRSLASNDIRITKYSPKSNPVKNGREIKLSSTHKLEDFKDLPGAKEILDDNISDIEKLHELKLLYTDEASGVFNKLAYQERSLSVSKQIAIDMDGVSKYQTEKVAKFGKEAGEKMTDDLVNTTLEELNKAFPSKVYRLGGGDEIAITTSGDVTQKLESVRQKIQSKYGKGANFSSQKGDTFNDADKKLTFIKEHKGIRGLDNAFREEYTSEYENFIATRQNSGGNQWQGDNLASNSRGVREPTEVRPDSYARRSGATTRGNIRPDGKGNGAREGILSGLDETTQPELFKPDSDLRTGDFNLPKYKLGSEELPYKGEQDLTTKILKDLEGKTTVSKQYILDATNRGELKQVERDLVRDILERETKIEITPKEYKAFLNAQDFGATSGERVNSATGRKLGSTKRPYGDYLYAQDRDMFNNQLYNENLKPSEDLLKFLGKNKDTINVSDFAKKVKAELLPLEPSTLRDGRYESITLPDEVRGKVAEYQERIYSSPIKTSAGDVHYSGDYPNANYFGHTRIEDMADNKTRRVIEVQSDLYQKGNLEREKIRIQGKSQFTSTTDRGVLKARGMSEKEIDDFVAKLDEKNKGIKADLAKREKEISKLTQYNDPTAHFRMIREEIKKAAQDGKTKLQFPTGETALKIEGLGENSKWIDISHYIDGDEAVIAGESNLLSPQKLKVGQRVSRVGNDGFGTFDPNDSWIVTNVLENGKFKAIPKETLVSQLTTKFKDISESEILSFMRNCL